MLFSSGKTIFYERAQPVSKILFLPRENKTHIFKPPCYVLFVIKTKRDQQNNRRKLPKYVIDKLTCKIMDLGPVCSFYEFYDWYILQ